MRCLLPNKAVLIGYQAELLSVSEYYPAVYPAQDKDHPGNLNTLNSEISGPKNGGKLTPLELLFPNYQK